MINKINSFNENITFKNSNNNERGSVLDRLHTFVKNSADMNDTVIVPRTIFKGYLGIMTGTTFVTIANFINKAKHPKLFRTSMIGGLLTSFYGTWAFVRPFILKDKVKEGEPVNVPEMPEAPEISPREMKQDNNLPEEVKNAAENSKDKAEL